MLSVNILPLHTVCMVVIGYMDHAILYPLQLAVVNLVDSIHCSNPSTFISTLLTSLSTMMQLELPHVNVLSKIDLLPTYGELREYHIGVVAWVDYDCMVKI